MINPFNIQHEIQSKKTATDIIYTLSTPPLSIGSIEYKKARISTKDNVTEIMLRPCAPFPSEKNTGVPIIKLEITEQTNISTLHICFGLPRWLYMIGTIFLSVIFLFGLAAIISYFAGKIEYFFVACIPWFVEIFGFLLVWISFRISAKQLMNEVTKRLPHAPQ